MYLKSQLPYPAAITMVFSDSKMPPVRPNLTLYLLTNSSLLPPNTTLSDHVRACIKGGATIVQLREKEITTIEFITLGKNIHAITKELGVPLLINDRVDVALAVGCEGVHIGWNDMDCKTARRLLGPDAIIGLSVSNHDQLAQALEAGPTYLGIGPIYATATKPDHYPPLGITGIRLLLEKIPNDLPTCVIGGINSKNVQRVMFLSQPNQSGKRPDGVAIISAIMTSTEPEKTCQGLANLILCSPPWAPISYQKRWSEPVEDLIPCLLPLLRRVRQHPPLVHHITNNVSKTFSANITLAIGASPIMSENVAEFEDLSALNNSLVSLVLNMGTFLNETDTKALFLKAMDAHNRRGNPVIFDPVGAGATAARRRFAKAVLEGGYCDVIKGNEGEILSIAGEDVKMRGVDGAGADGGHHRERELAVIVSRLAKKEGNIIVMTGPTDIISDGQKTYLLRNGDPIQTRVTGVGCVLSSVIGSTLAGANVAAEKLLAVIAAVSAFNVAAEQANSEPKPAGPASWAVRFVDVLAMDPEVDYEKRVKIEEINI